MNVIPPPRNAITSNSFTPFILKTASIPTSVKLYQAVPLDQDLQNELLNATLEEPPRWRRDNKLKHDLQYVQYMFRIYQSHMKVQTPDLLLLSEELYDHKSHTWQPLVIPFVLWARAPRESSTATATSRGMRNRRASKFKLSEGSSLGRHRKNHSQQQFTITRTVQDSDLNPVTESEEGTYIPKPGSEEMKVASLQTQVLANEQRRWSAEFAMRPAPADVDLKMKPDITLLQKDPFDPNGPNSWHHVVSFIELTSSEDSSSLRKQVTRKAYTVFVSQPGHRNSAFTFSTIPALFTR
ncbi:hypothetical protein JVU11DRAFT_3830 [Chiua virens]|nr:hypothetical protein JVU11DRAFT_3830 [Chiua virens]